MRETAVGDFGHLFLMVDAFFIHCLYNGSFEKNIYMDAEVTIEAKLILTDLLCLQVYIFIPLKQTAFAAQKPKQILVCK